MLKKILYIAMLLPLVAIAQSTDQNWVKSKTYKVPTTTSIATPTVTEAVVQVNYYDGLGRPIQQIANAQSNTGKDIITHFEYDAFGRTEKEFLPYVNQSASLNYNSSANSDVLTFYDTPAYENTQNPFSQNQFEASQLNRILKQAAPGEAWRMTSGHEIKFDYRVNIENEVKRYKAIATWNATNGLYEIAFAEVGHYAINELYKTVTKDENWTSGNNNTTQEFKNKEGQVVLKRTFNNNVAHDTFYIYDQFGNLTYVIPPAVSGAITQTVLDNMGYQYKYDYRNRLVEKKLPGKQWEYIVYDKLDRVVATGPAYNPYGGGDSNKGWLITKYDVLNRPVYTAWYSPTDVNTINRKVLQTTYNSATTYSENKTTSVSTINGIATKYTNSVSPSTFILLTVNYYDTYDYPNAPIVPTTLSDSTLPIATNVKGLPTGSWVRVIDVVGSASNEQSYTIYDTKFRPVRSYTKNYLGGYTQVDSKMDWAGKTEYTITKHKRLNTSIELITKDRFEYSVQDRLVKHIHKVNLLPEQLITYNTYDELGQLTNKKIGGTDVTGSNTLQKVDYTYNIRGWLKGINDITNLAPSTSENDLFAFKLSYNNPETATPLFNGNISETFWRTDSDNIKRKYAYQYDNLNRLLEANYSKPGSSSTLDNYLEKLTYDKNGNIRTLIRNGGLDTDGSSPVQEIDNLVYNYDVNNLNLLKKVVDNTTSPQGFKDGNNTNDDFTYDSNGNMIVDSNKGITEIIYNHLNLPVKITFGVNGHIEYIYNSVGQKLKKVVLDYAGQGSDVDYLGGFQYRNSVLQFFPTEEGYVNVTVTSKGSLTYKYVFNYTDHLGNIRLSYSLEGSVLKILEENHYYAFGLKHTNYNTDGFVFMEEGSENVVLTPVSPFLGSNYKYKYNGKELQEELGLNMYDYGFRNYDPALGRFHNMDEKSETSRKWSPYTYAYNNPMFFIDPDGMENERFDGVEYNKNRGGHWSDAVRNTESNSETPPDDVTVNSKGIVTNVVENDKPNRFFDENGTQLYFNDPDNDFSIINNWSEGDRLYYPITAGELMNAVLKAGLEPLMLKMQGHFDTALALTAVMSFGSADFTVNYLAKNYDEVGDNPMVDDDGIFRIGYASYSHFFRFENNTQTIYNLYDAGNFMWGNWMKANKYNYFITKKASQANELGGDSEADQRAIKNGFNFWNFKR
jgi:RHS repeat-associated protein